MAATPDAYLTLLSVSSDSRPEDSREVMVGVLPEGYSLREQGASEALYGSLEEVLEALPGRLPEGALASLSVEGLLLFRGGSLPERGLSVGLTEEGEVRPLRGFLSSFAVAYRSSWEHSEEEALLYALPESGRTPWEPALWHDCYTFENNFLEAGAAPQLQGARELVAAAFEALAGRTPPEPLEVVVQEVHFPQPQEVFGPGEPLKPRPPRRVRPPRPGRTRGALAPDSSLPAGDSR